MWKKWLKERSWYFWFVVILVIIAIVILLSDIGDHKMGDLGALDPDHLDECEEVLNENGEVGEVSTFSETYLEQNNVCVVSPSEVSVVSRGPRKWKREEMCREILQDIYKVPFKSCRPDFLKSSRTGRKLELDGYNESLQIAFEHNGKHHYEYPNTFHKTRQNFLDQLWRDRFKREKCDLLGIYLINIPYKVKLGKIREFIISKLPRDFD